MGVENSRRVSQRVEPKFGSESEFVEWLRTHARGRDHGVRLGIGDDAALLEIGRGHELILTADLSFEGIHFHRFIHPPRAIGHRALARSLSDIAAMGGIPRYALVSIGLSRDTPRQWVEEFYLGIFALAKRFGVAVVGGDTAVAPGRISIDITVAGEVEHGRAIRRSGARPGDQVFVTGRLGLSALGLGLLRARTMRRSKPDEKRKVGGKLLIDALQAHLYPEPRCMLGRFLSQNRLASALIDLSDGLSTDLHRLCQASKVGAHILASAIPVPENGPGAILKENDRMSLALNGGEDYELLFCVPRRRVRQIPTSYRGVRLCCIGEIQRANDISLIVSDGRKTPLIPAGYDHFTRKI